MTTNDMNGDNIFFVGVQGEHIIIIMRQAQKITKAEAINLAAWLVALADDNDEFGLMIEKVQNT